MTITPEDVIDLMPIVAEYAWGVAPTSWWDNQIRLVESIDRMSTPCPLAMLMLEITGELPNNSPVALRDATGLPTGIVWDLIDAADDPKAKYRPRLMAALGIQE